MMVGEKLDNLPTNSKRGVLWGLLCRHYALIRIISRNKHNFRYSKYIFLFILVQCFFPILSSLIFLQRKTNTKKEDGENKKNNANGLSSFDEEDESDVKRIAAEMEAKYVRTYFLSHRHLIIFFL